jgi:ribosomal protein S18 acetylase RimI-like enzyme
MCIRRATDADISQMHDVRMSVRENRLADASGIQPHDYAAMLRIGPGWVCEVDQRVVGFAVADLSRCSIWALFVHPDYERRGIGRMLHDAMIGFLFDRGMTRVSLTTDPDTRAERFYRAAGWVYAGRMQNGEHRYELTPQSLGKPS